MFSNFENKPHGCWGSAIFCFVLKAAFPASDIEMKIAAKNTKTLENQGLPEIKQNPENFFSGSFLLVDHQGLELDQPLKNAMDRRFSRTAFYVFSKVFSNNKFYH